MRVAIITANTDIYKGTKANESGEAVKLVAEEAGLEVVFMRALPLDREVLSTVMKRMTDGKTADLILTTGGVSVGEKDLLPGVIENLTGNVLFHGIQVKPGMPTMLSVVEDIPVLSLSGNPFAVAALFELLVGGYLADRAEEVYIQKKETKVLRQTFVKTGKPKRIVKGK